MWNPLAYLDYNNLWRTMDEMGKEVWHEEQQLSQLSLSPWGADGRDYGADRQSLSALNKPSGGKSSHPFWYPLVARINLRVASWQALLNPVLLRLSAQIPSFFWLWECQGLCLWLIFTAFPHDLVSNILRALQNSNIWPFLPWNSTCLF